MIDAFTPAQKILNAYKRSLTQQRKSEYVAGVVKYTHAPDVLQLDFDAEPPQYHVLCAELRKLELRAIFLSYQRSRAHFHVVVKLTQKLPVLASFFVQLYLGSDRYRERAGFVRYVHCHDRTRFVQVLFEEKINL